MAQTLKIKIKIEKQNFKFFDDLVNKVKELDKTFSRTLFSGSSSKKFIENTRNISKEVGNINANIQETFDNVKNGVRSSQIGLFGRLATSAADSFGSLAVKTTAAATAGAFFASQIDRIASSNAGDILSVLQSGITGLFNFVDQRFFQVFLNINNALSSTLELLPFIQGQFVNILDVFVPLVNTAGSWLNVFVSGSLTLTAFNFLLSETRTLFRRLLGQGVESLGIVARVTRLVEFLDDSFNRTFSLVGSGLKTVGGLIATQVVSPLLVIPTILNGITESLTKIFRFSFVRFQALLGIGSARFVLGLNEVRKTFPVLAKNISTTAKALGNATKNASRLTETRQAFGLLRKDVAGLEDNAKGLSRIKLPLAAQIQVISTEIKILIRDLLTQIRVVVNLIGRASGTTAADIKKIGEEARKQVDIVSKESTKVGDKLQSSFLTGRRDRSFLFGDPEKQKRSFFSLSKSVDSFSASLSNARQRARELNQARIDRRLQPVQITRKVSDREGQQAVAGNIQKSLTNLNSSIKNQEALKGLTGSLAQLSRFTEEFFRATRREKTKDAERFLQNIQNIKLGDSLKNVDEVNKKIASFVQNVSKLTGKESVKDFGSAARNLVTAYNKGIQSVFTRGRARKTVDLFLDITAGFFETGTFKFTKAGKETINQFSKGMESNKQQAVKSLREVTKQLSEEELPNSPAKKGPLRNLFRQGGEIVNQFSLGMIRNKKRAVEALRKVTTPIAKEELPNSPALFGPLRFLFRQGREIVNQIALGIQSGTGIIVNAIRSVNQSLIDEVNKANQSFLFAERVGESVESITLLQNAIGDFGVEANDIQLIVSKLFSQKFAPDTIRGLDEIGINLDEIRASASPSVTLLTSLADVFDRFGEGSEQTREALQAFGIFGTSNIINVLRRGRQELEGFIDQNARLQLVTGQQFAENSNRFQALINRFNNFRRAVTQRLFDGILPQLESVGRRIQDFVANNIEEINVFLRTIGKIVGRVIKEIADFVEFAFNEPEKAIALISQKIIAIGNSIVDSFNSILARLGGVTKNFLLSLAVVIFDFSKNLIRNTFVFLFGETLTALNNLRTQITDKIASFLGGVLFSIQSFFEEVFSVEFAKNVGKALIDFISGLPDLISGAISSVKDAVTNAISGLFKSEEPKKEFRESFNLTDDAKAIGSGLTTAFSLLSDQNQQLLASVGGVAFKGFTGIDVEEASEAIDKIEEIAEKAKETKKKVKENKTERNFVDVLKDSINETQGSFDQLAFDAKNFGSKLAEGFDPAKSVTDFISKFEDDISKAREQQEEQQSRLLQLLGDRKKRTEELTDATNRQVDATNNLADAASRFGSVNVGKILGGLDLARREAEADLFLDKLRIKVEDNAILRNSIELREFRIRQEKELQEFNQSLIGQNEAFAESRRQQFEELQAQQLQNFQGEQQVEGLLQGFTTLGQTVQGFGSIFNSVFEGTGKKIKEFFFLSKAAAIAEATINNGVAITKALGLPFPLNLVQSAAIAAKGAVQIAAIRNQGFAEGGKITEGTGPKADDVPINVSRGEYVQPAASVSYYGDQVMEAMRQRIIPRGALRNLIGNMPKAVYAPRRSGFASGGSTTNATARTQQQSPIIVQNIVSEEVTLQAMQSQPGQNVFKNLIRENQEEIRDIVFEGK